MTRLDAPRIPATLLALAMAVAAGSQATADDVLQTSARDAAATAVLLPGSAPDAEPPPLEAYLGGGRFRVSARWQAAGDAGDAVPLSLTPDSTALWFFRPGNLEMMVKALDGCAVNQHYWVFAAGLTNVGVELTVEDTVTGVSRPYSNSAGSAFAPVQDTTAFATCSEQRECGRGTAAEIAATPRGHFEIEWLAVLLGGRVTASEDLYARLVADLDAIDGLAPETADLEFRGRWFPNALHVEFHRSFYDEVVAGTYEEWDCLNDWYGVTDVFPLYADNLTGVVKLTFGGLYHNRLIGPDYAALFGAVGFRPVGTVSPFPHVPTPVGLCAQLDGDAIHYYFRKHEAVWHAVSPAPGETPTSVEDFNLGLPTLPPPWVEDLHDCTTALNVF